jgi:drug/metabolite transporter (DMT)-like permease
VYALLLALFAAVLNALGDLLQRRAARTQPDELAGSLRLLVHLARRPVWVAGLLASLAGLLTHVVALSIGTIAVVQPVLVLELPLAVLAASWLSSSRLVHRDWASVVLMAAGLGLFVWCLSPGDGEPLALPGAVWLAGLGLLLAVVAALVVLAQRLVGARRGMVLGIAAGIGYGVTGVLFAAAGATATRDGLAVLGSWQPYAAIAVGVLSFCLLQNALAAGKLVAAAPGLTLANPLVAVLWGVLLFGEEPQAGVWLVGAGVGVAVLVSGTVLLARSPMLNRDARPTPRHDDAGVGAARPVASVTARGSRAA